MSFRVLEPSIYEVNGVIRVEITRGPRSFRRSFPLREHHGSRRRALAEARRWRDSIRAQHPYKKPVDMRNLYPRPGVIEVRIERENCRFCASFRYRSEAEYAQALEAAKQARNQQLS